MLSASTNVFLSLFGWAIVPDFITKNLLFLLQIKLHLLPAHQPGSPPYRRHYAYTFAIVVLGYLLYSMIQSARSMPPNFYQILGVRPDVDEMGLKLAFRNFARRNHPDRPDVGMEGAELFMTVRNVFEALKDPVKRFAYDRFGPDVLDWKHCKTTREFLHHGLMQASGYHIVAGLVLLLWSMLGSPSPVSFWRYTLFAFLLLSELALILLPSPSPASSSSDSVFPSPNQTTTILHRLFPQRITHQHILFLHQLFMFLSVALSRVAPQLFPAAREEDPRMEAAILERTQALVGVADRETSIMLHTDLRSLLSPSPSPIPSSLPSSSPSHPSLARPAPLTPASAMDLLSQLTPEMEALIIEANIKKDTGPLRSTWEAAIRRGTGEGGSPSPKKKTRNFWERDEDAAVDGEVQVGEGELGEGMQVQVLGETVLHPPGELPSPRPSPSPPPPQHPGMHRKGSSYVRGRSVSY